MALPRPTIITSGGDRIHAYRRFLNPTGIGGEARIAWKLEEECGYINELTISDCSETISLEFPHHNARNRKRSLKKIDLMISSLLKFRNIIEHMPDKKEKKK